VDSNGYISLPFVGEVLVQRLTVREVREKLDTILSEYLESPVSNVRLISFHYTVIGEVQNQGKYDIYDDRLNIMEALGSAGGLTQFANYELVKILRTEEGVSTMYTINLLDANLPKSDYYYIRPNDVIIVDPLKNKNFRLNSSRNITLILSAVATSITLILAVDNLSN
jgi:polysaccharide export outer membrane protein